MSHDALADHLGVAKEMLCRWETGALIQSRATHQNIVERVFFEDDIRTFRISTNTLGNGFIEAVANSTIQDIRASQPASMRGTLLRPSPQVAMPT